MDSLKLVLFFSFLTLGIDALAHNGVVIHNNDVKAFTHNGNKIKGLATPNSGSKQFEVWKSEIAVGSKTPLHKHASDEIFVLLKGKAKFVVGEDSHIVTAPATVIAPANKNHQVFNIGTDPIEQIVIIGAGSKIWGGSGKLLNLPWRK